MNAEQIKKAIFEKKTKPPEAVEKAEIYGIEGWLFRPTSAQMEGWRVMVSAVKDDGSPDDEIRQLAPAKLVQISFRDSEGKPVFEELDCPIIGGMPDDQINPIRMTILRINGMSAEGFKDIVKNLLTTLGTVGLYDLLASMDAPCPNCSKSTASTSCESSGSQSVTGPAAGPRKSTGPSLQATSSVKK